MINNIIKFEDIPVLIVEKSPTGFYYKGFYKGEIRIFIYYKKYFWMYRETDRPNTFWFYQESINGRAYTNYTPEDELDLNWIMPYFIEHGEIK